MSHVKYQKFGNQKFGIGNCRRWRAGFTIMEVLIAIGLIVLLSAVLSVIVLYTNRSAAIEQTRAKLTTENRLLVDETTRTVKEASTVLASAAVLGTLYTTGTQVLVLQAPAVDANQNLIANMNDRMVFRRNGADYQFIQDGETGSVRPDIPSRIFSRQISAIAFTYYDVNGNVLNSNFQNAYSVRISSTLIDTVRNQTITSTLNETATLRNK